MSCVSIEEAIAYVTTSYAGLRESKNWRARGLFYNPEAKLPMGTYVLTFKEKDGSNDKTSKVSHTGVYRLNLKVSNEAFRDLFGKLPQRPAAGETVPTGHDFTALDQAMPHPVYGWMPWICVLNPQPETFEQLKPLIQEGVELAEKQYLRKIKK